MDSHYFTCGQLMNILAELEKITDNEQFVKYIFSTIHYEVMKVSYINTHYSSDHEHCGTNLLIEGLEEAKHKAKNKLLKYCYSIKETDGIALNVLNKVADAKACIQEINEQNKSIPFWRWGLRNYLRKVKRGILQEHIPFSDIGSLFLYLYIKRGIGDSLCFRYDLIRFSRHVSKKKVQNEKNRFSIKNLFRKASLSTIRVINKS